MRKTVKHILRSVVFALLLLATPLLLSAQIKPPKGFDGKVYKASMALEATSVERGITEPKFLCTVTAFEKVQGGYLLVGAGHCTPANDVLPRDMVFFVSDNMGTEPHPVYLLKSIMLEPDDWALYYFPTKAKYPVIPLGNESTLRVGDKTVDVNFSLGITKVLSQGVVASTVIRTGQQYAKGFYIVDAFASHGASGSAVVSEKSHKIVGLLIAGWDGATVGNAIEPISSVTTAMQFMNIPEYIRLAMLPKPPVSIEVPKSVDNGSIIGMNEDPGIPYGVPIQTHHPVAPRVTPPRTAPPAHAPKGGDAHRTDRKHDKETRGRDGRRLDPSHHHRIDIRRDCRMREGRPEIFFGGFWFASYGLWPEWVYNDDIYVEMVGPDIYVIYAYRNPAYQVQVFVVE